MIYRVFVKVKCNYPKLASKNKNIKKMLVACKCQREDDCKWHIHGMYMGLHETFTRFQKFLGLRILNARLIAQTQKIWNSSWWLWYPHGSKIIGKTEFGFFLILVSYRLAFNLHLLYFPLESSCFSRLRCFLACLGYFFTLINCLSQPFSLFFLWFSWLFF